MDRLPARLGRSLAGRPWITGPLLERLHDGRRKALTAGVYKRQAFGMARQDLGREGGLRCKGNPVRRANQSGPSPACFQTLRQVHEKRPTGPETPAGRAQERNALGDATITPA
jgi:hypothetical protein